MGEKFSTEIQPGMAEKYVKNYKQLQEILIILKELGLTPIDYQSEVIQSQWDIGNTFPIANEGAQGIRINRSRKGELTVSFTNGFENPNDPKRVEIAGKLREKGFDAV